MDYGYVHDQAYCQVQNFKSTFAHAFHTYKTCLSNYTYMMLPLSQGLHRKECLKRPLKFKIILIKSQATKQDGILKSVF